jgi:peptidoglycan-associated lipoprotein
MKRLLIAALFAAGACAHHEAKNESTMTGNSGSSSSGRVATQPTEQKSAESTGSVDPEASCPSVRVHFAFNSSDLEHGEKRDLERSADCLKTNRALRVSIEGNADERGTEEYNIALGDRRANAVRKYLESFGVSDSQLKTVSYGKENPICTEHDESCWSQNRRAELNLATAKKSHR